VRFYVVKQQEKSDEFTPKEGKKCRNPAAEKDAGTRQRNQYGNKTKRFVKREI